jgi:uncharacterized protein (TIGR03067 family)
MTKGQQRLGIAMTSGFMMLVAFSFPLAADEGKEEKVNTHQECLQGRWEITSEGYYGDSPETNSGRRLVIAGDTFTFEEAGRILSRGTFKLKPSESPKAIDIEVTEGRIAPRGSKYLGIYKLDGDILAWCWSGPGSTDRPRAFSAGPSYARHNLLTFKRVKP